MGRVCRRSPLPPLPPKTGSWNIQQPPATPPSAIQLVLPSPPIWVPPVEGKKGGVQSKPPVRALGLLHSRATAASRGRGKKLAVRPQHRPGQEGGHGPPTALCPVLQGWEAREAGPLTVPSGPRINAVAPSLCAVLVLCITLRAPTPFPCQVAEAPSPLFLAVNIVQGYVPIGGNGQPGPGLGS